MTPRLDLSFASLSIAVLVRVDMLWVNEFDLLVCESLCLLDLTLMGTRDLQGPKWQLILGPLGVTPVQQTLA